MTSLRARLKYVTRFGYGDALPTDEPKDGPFQVFGSNGPFTSFTRANTGAPAIIIGRKGSFGKVNWTPHRCFASDTTFVVDSSTCRYNLRWVYWLLQTLRLDDLTEEAAVPGLNREDAYNRPVLIPPDSKQRAIADYLDRETSRLDALIAAKERLLGLLAEKRQALITRAVTCGLDRNAPLRNSGIPWLGPIPAHWEVKRGKWIFRQSALSVRDDDEIVTCFRDGQVTLRRNRREDGFMVAEKEVGYQGIRQGQLILHSMDAFAGAIGVSDSDGKCSPEYIICEPRESALSSHYYGFLLRWMALAGFIQASCPAVRERAPRIRFNDLAEMLLPIPPLVEQEAIVTMIGKEAEKLRRSFQATDRTIALLKERRSALIAAVVTGQIQVQ